MNLRWRRGTPSLTKGNDTEIVEPDIELGEEQRNWAENILARLNDIEKLTLDLKAAYPNKTFFNAFQILNIFHVPGRSLKVLGCFSGTAQTDILLLTFYPNAEYSFASKQTVAHAINKNRIGLLPDWFAVAKLFPEDAELPGLESMLDLGRVGTILGQTEAAIQDANWKMMAYQEGKRCTLRYQFGGNGEAFIGKIQSSSETALSHQRLCKLWGNSARQFQMPKPIAYAPDLGARWETFCPGISLEDALQQNTLEALIALITSQLIHLHNLNIQDVKTVTPAIVLRRIERKILPRINVSMPTMAHRADNIFTALQRNLSWVEGNVDVTLHGDFHIANFLLHDGTLVFIDLDDLSKGDPCYDLALFASRLLLRNLHHADCLPETLVVVANLPKLYTSLSGRVIRQEAFAWYMAALLVGRQVKLCMREDAPNKELMISQLLDWTERSMAKGYFAGNVSE